MLTRERKREIVEEFNRRFRSNPSFFVVEYKGLTVKEMQQLRDQLREAGARLSVVKNTLLRRASKETDAEKVADLFTGPTALALCEGEPAPVAKIFTKVKKELPVLVVKGALVEGSPLTEEEIERLAKLPSREVLLAQLLGVLSAPMANLAGVLRQTQARLLHVLEAVREKKENEGG